MTHSRRTFLWTAGAALAGTALFDSRRLAAAGIRKDVGGLSATSPELVAYGNAITAMKALPPSNPLSWDYQAAIHGKPPGASFPAWRTCEHGTLEFLSWHRMYLYWFERIIRKQSGDPHFMLPFWNYELPTERTLPVPFRTAGTGLFVADADRGTGWNSGTAFLQASAVSTAGCLPQVPFSSFSGNLEGTPHAAVHVAFGFTGGWMGSVPTAAQDPIFYLHHCNIDRLWNVWLAQGGGRTDPLGDATWKTKKFLFFNEHGKQVWMTGCDILRAQEQLDYGYEGEPAQVKEYCLKIPPLPKWIYELLIQCPPIKLPPGPDPAPFEVDIATARQRLVRAVGEQDVQVALRLTDVVADRQPSVYWEVYAGLARDERAVADSKAYVGNVALFGGGVGDHGHGSARAAQIELGLNAAMQTALERTAEKTLSLRFVPMGAGLTAGAGGRNAATVSIAKSEIVVRRLQRGG